MLPILSPRARRMNQLLARGHAANQEILEADFGAWPPVGLDIVSFPNEKIEFKSIMSAKNLSLLGKIQYLLFYGGYAIGEENRIFFGPVALLLSKFSLSSSTNSNVGHEHTHVMQHRSVGYLKIDKPAADFFDLEDSHAPPRRLFGRVKQGLGRAAGRVTGFGRQGKDGSIAGYLRVGIEIQARVHELLSSGYPQWGRLPASPHELWAAMASQGMLPPPEIQCEMKTSPEGQAARAIFGEYARAGLWEETAANLNTAARSVGTPRGWENFWRQLMPEIYGSLIELYGDRLGRERMGLGPNLNLGAALFNDMKTGSEPITPEAVQGKAEQLSPAQLTSLAEHLVGFQRWDDAHIHKDRTRQIFCTLMDVPRFHTEMLSENTKTDSVLWETFQHHPQIAHALVQAGVNFDRPITVDRGNGYVRHGSVLDLMVQEIHNPCNWSGKPITSYEKREKFIAKRRDNLKTIFADTPYYSRVQSMGIFNPIIRGANAAQPTPRELAPN